MLTGRRLPLLLALSIALGAAAPAAAMATRPETPPESAQPVTATTHWQGTLKAGGAEIVLLVHLARHADGTLSGTLDVPAQGAKDLALESMTQDAQALRFKVGRIGAEFEGAMGADGRRAVGAWKQGGMSLPLTFERTDAPVTHEKPQTPKPPFPYRQEEVSYVNPQGGHQLAGTITLPAGQGPFPAVVLITGSGPQDRDETILGHKPFAVIADYLTRRGFAVLRVDDRGVGKSTGDVATASTMDFATDVEASLAFLRRHAAIDSKRVGLLGHSEGGIIAPIVASRHPEVAFLVLLAGSGLKGEQVHEAQVRAINEGMGKSKAEVDAIMAQQERVYATLRQNPPAQAAPKLRALLAEILKGQPEAERAIEAQVTTLNSPWFRTFLATDPQPYLAQVKAPVLALNGDKDCQVSAGANLPAIEKALKRGGNKDVTTVRVPGANHLFQPAKTGMPTEYAEIETTIMPSVLDDIGDWLEKRFIRH